MLKIYKYFKIIENFKGFDIYNQLKTVKIQSLNNLYNVEEI